MSRRDFRVSAILISAVCAIGLLFAGYQYFLLRSIHDALKSHGALETSLAVVLRTDSGFSNESLKEIRVYLDTTAVIRRTVETLVDDVKYGQVIQAALWFAIIFVAIYQLRRKAKQNDS